jgi:hypothetical protein
MDYLALSKRMEEAFESSSVRRHDLAAACEEALREAGDLNTDATGAKVRDLTMAGMLLECRYAENPAYDAIDRIRFESPEERRVVADALRHLLLPEMLDDPIEQAESWLAEMRRVMSLGLKRRMRPRTGDILLVPLFDGRLAYAQVFDPAEGEIQVLDAMSPELKTIEQLRSASVRFGPLKTYYPLMARKGPWLFVGALPLFQGKSPAYIHRSADRDPSTKEMRYGPWYLISGRQCTLIGDTLPVEYRDYELSGISSVYFVERRIITGKLSGYDRLLFATEPWFEG